MQAKEVCYFETSEIIYQTTLRKNPEDLFPEHEDGSANNNISKFFVVFGR